MEAGLARRGTGHAGQSEIHCRRYAGVHPRTFRRRGLLEHRLYRRNTGGVSVSHDIRDILTARKSYDTLRETLAVDFGLKPKDASNSLTFEPSPFVWREPKAIPPR